MRFRRVPSADVGRRRIFFTALSRARLDERTANARIFSAHCATTMTTTTTNADDAMKRVYALEAKCLALEADAATASSRAREHADALAKAQARFRELDEAKTHALEARDATVRALENKGTRWMWSSRRAADVSFRLASSSQCENSKYNASTPRTRWQSSDTR